MYIYTYIYIYIYICIYIYIFARVHTHINIEITHAFKHDAIVEYACLSISVRQFVCLNVFGFANFSCSSSLPSRSPFLHEERTFSLSCGTITYTHVHRNTPTDRQIDGTWTGRQTDGQAHILIYADRHRHRHRHKHSLSQTTTHMMSFTLAPLLPFSV